MTNGNSLVARNNKSYAWIRKKHSESLKGNKNAKLKPGTVHPLKGKTKSVEHKNAISKAKKGKPLSVTPEWKAKDSSMRRWINNGIDEKFRFKTELLPLGYSEGRIFCHRMKRGE